MDDHLHVEPILTSEQRQTLASITYFLDQCEPLRGRGLLTDEAYRTIAAEYTARRDSIESRGRYEGAVATARRLAANDAREAIPWADLARQIDPDRPDAWVLAIESRKGWQDDEAQAVCAEAVARFAGFPISPADLRHEREVRQTRAEQRRTEDEAADLLARAGAALDARRDAEVIALTTELLERQPDQSDARVLRAFALQRLGRLDEALTAYREISAGQPENPVWTRWVRDIEHRLAARPAAGSFVRSDVAATGHDGLSAAAPTPARPRVSWSSVAGEFMADHWQKLILCLAVLLIVVSSNVGLYQWLGPRLWSPPGKCLLALVYTAMFAGLGRGLVRWGAGRAGRMMLVTTLILVPFDFMLAGEMRLLTEPTLARLAVLVLDALALGYLIWRVVGALDLPRPGRATLGASFFALCATNLAAAPGVGWPLTVFLLPSAIFSGAVWRLNSRALDEDDSEHRDFAAIALGVLAFASFAATLRTGVFVLHLAPTLFGVPVMLGAIAAVQTAHHLGRRKQDPQWVAGMRFGGLVLSGLGLALALARPPGPSTLYSGNTLAVALLGLALYAGSLRADRRPAYLYFCFGALFLAYFGAFYFVVDMVHTVEEVARRALGYQQKLPLPFKAINGLVFNAVLALLAIFFAKRWKDERLARHAHYIGVPFSIAACVFSGFEPKAALICLSGYAVLYAIGACLFATPWVVYLSCAAVIGAAHFGTMLVPGVSVETHALLASVLGLAFWSVETGLRARRVAPAYLRPLVHATLALMAGAMALAAVSVAWPGGVTLASATTFLLVGLLAALIGLDEPRESLATLAVVDVNLGLGLLIAHLDARWRLGLEPAGFAIAATATAVAQAALGDRLARRGGLYSRPVLGASFVQLAVGISLVAWQATRFVPPIPRADLGAIAAALALAAVAVVTLLRVFPLAALAHLALSLALGAWLALAEIALGGRFAVPSAYGALAAGFGPVLLAAVEALRSWLGTLKSADPDFASVRPVRAERLAAAIPDFAPALAVLACVIAGLGLSNGPELVATLALGAATILWATRYRREPLAVDLGLVMAVASTLCATAWRVGWADFGLTLGWLALTTAGASAGLWWAALAWRGSGRDDGEFYAGPCLRLATILTACVVPLAIVARLGSKAAFLPALAALGVNVASSLLLSTIRRRPGLTYRAVISLVVATYVTIFSLGGPSPHGWLVLSAAASLQAIVLTAVGLLCGSRPEGSWLRIHARPLFVSARALTVLALVPGIASPTALLLAALSFLLLVKAFGSTFWIYPAIASVGWAVNRAFLLDMPLDRLVTAALVAAYELWGLGVLVRRVNPALRYRLALPGLDFDLPFFNSALCAGLVATVLGVDEFITSNPFDWGTSAGLALNLAVLAVLMLKPYPHLGWAHLAVVLGSASVALVAAPRLNSSLGWLPVVLALANLWRLAERGLRSHEGWLCRRCGVAELGYSDVPGLWSMAFLTIALAAVVGVVAVATFATAFAVVLPWGLGGWWSVVPALGLAGLFVVLGPRRHDREFLLIRAHALALLLTWWAFAPSSPLIVRWGSGAAEFLPLATALAALGTVAAGLRSARVDREAMLTVYLEHVGLALALVGVVFTNGLIDPVTIATLLVATASFGLLATGLGRVDAAYLGALTWGATCIEAALRVGWWRGFDLLPDRAFAASLGAAVALLALDVLATRRPRFARPLESVALLCAGIAAGSVALGTAWAGRPVAVEAYLGVGVLLAVALFALRLAPRWGAEWLVYAGQAAVLGAYFVHRAAFPRPVATDAALLTLIGYLDFGLAEAARRLRLDPFARPTLYVSLVLPLLPLGMMASTLELSELNLFVLFSVATFYGVACFQMRWKTLGYAAAVLYNAALWVLWGRVGWALADHPQFFLVPVGFSAILFAEVNREDLARPNVNAIRGVGLILIYISLAFPIWQFQSLGAWVALLLLSLLGIFIGIGLRVQTFVWLGLVGFTLDVVYQLGRMGLEHSLAKWAIMLTLGLLLILFVALNEKKGIVLSMRDYYERVRQWE